MIFKAFLKNFQKHYLSSGRTSPANHDAGLLNELVVMKRMAFIFSFQHFQFRLLIANVLSRATLGKIGGVKPLPRTSTCWSHSSSLKNLRRVNINFAKGNLASQDWIIVHHQKLFIKGNVLGWFLRVIGHGKEKCHCLNDFRSIQAYQILLASNC